MTFIVDTVGDIALPDGTKPKGVILTVPAGSSPEQQLAAMRDAARFWGGRVTLKKSPGSPSSTLHEAGLCIDVDEGLLEDLPAEWDVCPEDGTCKLYRFQIGGLTLTRDDAIAMTGKAHVEAQEDLVLEQFMEARDPLDDSDEAYDTWKETAA